MKNKHLFLILLAALLMPWAANAQTTVKIGDGTATSNTNPIGTYYNYSITEQLYTAEEIGTAGTISSISFYYMGIAAKDIPLVVYMANVDAENLSTGISLADADEVFNGTLPVTTTAGWVTITLDTPFAYDGTSNLLIGCIKDYLYYFSGQSWQGTATTATMARYTQSDYDGPYTTSTVPGSTQTNRPNIQMVITAGSGPVCEKPATFEVSNVTASSATLTWTGGSGNYNVEYKGGSVADWTAYLTNTTSTSANLTGLTPGTAYQYRVQSVCGSDVSGWKSVSFSTMFGIPLVEPFGSAIPTGWNMYTGLLANGTATLEATSYAWSFGSNNSVFDNHARVNIYSNYQRWLVMPAVMMENNVQLTFDLALTTYSGNASPTAGGQPDDKFIVLISNDNMATWNVLRQWDNAGSEYVYDNITNNAAGEAVAIDLSSYAGQNVIVAFYGESTESNGDNNLHIDNVSIDYIPACAKPLGLAVNYEGGTEATISWNSDATAWNMKVNGTPINGTITNPYTLTGLELATTYEVQVQANCGADGTSEWTDAVSFTTDLCMPENQCAITYELADSYGDGWNGNTLSVVDVLTGETIATWTVPSGSNSASGSLALCEGREIQFVWAGTSWPEENSFTVYDINGDIICQHVKDDNGPSVGVLATYTMSCTVSSCRKPTNLAVSEVGPRSATLTWVENGEAEAWEVEVTDLDGGQVTTWNAGRTNYEIVGLAPATNYSVRVKPVCADEKWSDPLTFTTEVACPAPVLTIVETTPTAATFSWTGEAQGYEMEYMVNPSFTFEDGTLQGWTNLIVNADGGQWLHSNDNPGGYMDPTASGNPYYPDLAHNGTGFAMCYSFIDNDGAYNTEAYLVSPRSYLINNGASMNFWYDMANDSYPEYFEVCVATAANPTADDFTAIWTSDAKGSNGQKAAVRHRNTRYQNWREVTIDLSAYAGQTIWIAFHDVNEDMYEVWIDDVLIDNGNLQWISAPAPIASPYTLALEPGTEYLVRVRAICGGDDGESAWTTVTVTTPSNCDAPTALNVTNLMPTTATLNWTGYQDNFEVRYRIPASQEVLFFEDFEGTENNALPDGWTTIDSDGDGKEWYTINQESFAAYSHSGQGIATSASYDGDDLTPDNWLITPQIALQGTMKVYLRAQDPSWADEHYAIYLSTTGNTVDDFTVTLVEESYNLSGEYIEVTADLSSYNGTMGYIAIRHFNCEGQFRINVDDFGLYGGEIPAGDWITVTSSTTNAEITGLDPETDYEWQVRGVNNICTDGYTEWSEMSTFTTPGECDNPNTFHFENLEATTATLTWIGYQESFNVRYRTAEISYEFWDDFSDGFVNWTGDNLSSDNYVDQVTSSGIMGYIMFWDDDLGAQTMISNELEPTPSGTSLSFYTATGGVSTYKVGYSSTDNNLDSFTWSEVFTCPDDNYFHEFSDENVPEGTKYIAIQFVSNVPDDNGYSYFIVTYVDLFDMIAEAGEWVELTVNEPSVTMEPLTPETEYEVYVQGICGDGEDDVTDWMGGYFDTPAEVNITQTIELYEGYNWVSFYVENEDPVALLDMLKDALGENGVTIESAESSTEFDGEEWFGFLDDEGINSQEMYLIVVSNDCTIELQGMPANPNHEIDINPGYTWIGFPGTEETDIADALANFRAEEGDQIEGAEGMTEYDGEEWFGFIETLVPGQGYMYYSTSDQVKSLIFMTGAKSRHTNPMTAKLTKRLDKSPTSIDLKAIKGIEKTAKLTKRFDKSSKNIDLKTTKGIEKKQVRK